MTPARIAELRATYEPELTVTNPLDSESPEGIRRACEATDAIAELLDAVEAAQLEGAAAERAAVVRFLRAAAEGASSAREFWRDALGPLEDTRIAGPRLAPAREPYEAMRARVALEYGVTAVDIDGASRMAHIVRARHELWRRLRAQGWSLPAIGAAAGRDHTTVLVALRKYRVRVAVEPLVSASEITAEGPVGS